MNMIVRILEGWITGPPWNAGLNMFNGNGQWITCHIQLNVFTLLIDIRTKTGG